MSQRVVVVTGSAGGIGAAIVARFTAAGDVVVGLDLVDGVDLTDPGAAQAAANRVLAEHGRIDVLCNNAGVGAVGDVVDAAPDDWSRVFAVNVFAMAHLSRAVLPAMRAARAGCIVNTCSVAASVGLAERAVYSASKGRRAGPHPGDGRRRGPLRHPRQLRQPGTVSSPWVQRVVAATPDPDATLDAAPPPAPRPPRQLRRGRGHRGLPGRRRHVHHGTDVLLDGGITGVHLVD
jgi:hypothetical protein